MNGQEKGKLKRRLASGRACLSCRNRKNRCDGVHPICGCCKSRGIHCSYAGSVADELSYEELESLYLEAKGLRDKATSSHSVESSGRELSGQEEFSGREATGNTTPQHIATASHTDRENRISQVLEDRHRNGSINMPAESANGSSFGTAEETQPVEHSRRSSTPTECQEPNGYFGGSSTFAFVSEVRTKSLGQEVEPERRPPRARNEAQFHRSLHEIERLPHRDLADRLVDAYFDHVHPLYPFVHEQSFRRRYEGVLRTPLSLEENPGEIWIGLLNLIFAYGCEFSQATTQQSLLDLSSRFLDRARSIILNSIFGPGSLELVQALLLMCHFLQGTPEPDECWNLVGVMIRMAVGIGLHLNPSEKLNAIELEMRKRIWWGCVSIDRTLSMKLGRPPSVRQLEEIDVDLPLNVDDRYISADFRCQRQPAGLPSLMEFFIQTIKQSKVIDCILQDLYLSDRRTKNPSNGSGPSEKSTESLILGRTVSLDGQLLSWWSNIPLHLRQSPETATDEPQFQRQRNVILLRFLNLRLLLHRQSFLIFSRHDIHDPFQRAIAVASAQVCVDCAQKTIQLIDTLYRQGLTNSLWYNLHYIFTAIGVLLLLRTLDGAKRNTLNLGDEDWTLECGMAFLRITSARSALAAKYAAILERLQAAQTSSAAGAGAGATGGIPDLTPGTQRQEATTNLAELRPAEALAPAAVTEPLAWTLGTQGNFDEIFSQQAPDQFSLDFDGILYAFGM